MPENQNEEPSTLNSTQTPLDGDTSSQATSTTGEASQRWPATYAATLYERLVQLYREEGDDALIRLLTTGVVPSLLDLENISIEPEYKNGARSTKSLFSEEVAPDSIPMAKYQQKHRLMRKMAYPRAEKVARLYAESVLTKHDVSMKDIADEAGLTVPQVNAIVSAEAFPMVLQKYLPLEETMQRHSELMNQNDDLAVAAKMVELGYKAHGKLEKKQAGPTTWTNFIQNLNIQHDGEGTGIPARGQVVEATELVSDSEEERHRGEDDAEPSAD